MIINPVPFNPACKTTVQNAGAAARHVSGAHNLRIAVLALVTACLLCIFASASLLAQQGAAKATIPAPAAASANIRVEFFGAENGYAVGTSTVVMLCVVCNVGPAPLDANTLELRCYALNGLDYTEGELSPLIPALKPNQRAAFRWRLQPNDRNSPLVASVIISSVVVSAVPGVSVQHASQASQQGAPSPAPAAKSILHAETNQAVLTIVPHLAGSGPDVGTAPATPMARAKSETAQVGNDRVMMRILQAAAKSPIGELFAKTPGGWEQVAAVWPLLKIRAASEGQSPWWLNFQWTQTEVHTDAESATITLNGKCEQDWEAQVTLQARKDSGVLDGKLRLKARRTCRLFTVRLPRLTAPTDRTGPVPPANGSPVLVAGAASANLPENLAATHKGAATGGITWPSHPPLPDWIAFALPQGDTDHTVQLGADWNAGERGEVVLPGGIIDFAFRLFCIAPSSTVKDAQRLALP